MQSYKYVYAFIFLLLNINYFYAQESFSSFLYRIAPISSSGSREMLVTDYMNKIIPSGTPIIENDTAHFLFWDNEASNVSVGFGGIREIYLVGDFTGWGYEFITMKKLSGTKLYYYSMTFESTARLEYAFIINNVYWIPDPFNPQQVQGTSSSNSVLVMPEYKAPWEIDYLTDIAHGICEEFTFHSNLMNRDYPVTVYLPPDYDPNKTNGYPAAYFQDGQSYLIDAKAKNIIDNLLANDLIVPIIGVFVDPVSRNAEYAFLEKHKFSNFFANELVPFIDDRYNTSRDTHNRLVAGVSFGGNISALISYNYAEIFANCGLQSASFWPGNYEAVQLITEGAKKDIRYFSTWGSYEYDITAANRELKDTLIALGYDLTWAEYYEAHHWEFFKRTIDDMLINFFASPQNTPNEYSGELPEIFDLSQNYPNPFNSITNITFYLPKDSHVKINIFNTLGKKISTIGNTQYSKGKHTVTFDGKNLSSGVYYYSLITDLKVQTQVMVLLK